MCFCASRYVGHFTGDSRLLFILMTVICTTNHGPQAVRRTGLARIKSSDWQSPIAEDSSMPPGNSAQLGSQSNCKRKEFGPKSGIEDSGVSRESQAELSPHEAASLHPHALFRVRQSESNRN